MADKNAKVQRATGSKQSRRQVSAAGKRKSASVKKTSGSVGGAIVRGVKQAGTREEGKGHKGMGRFPGMAKGNRPSKVKKDPSGQKILDRLVKTKEWSKMNSPPKPKPRPKKRTPSPLPAAKNVKDVRGTNRIPSLTRKAAPKKTKPSNPSGFNWR